MFNVYDYSKQRPRSGLVGCAYTGITYENLDSLRVRKNRNHFASNCVGKKTEHINATWGLIPQIGPKFRVVHVRQAYVPI